MKGPGVAVIWVAVTETRMTGIAETGVTTEMVHNDSDSKELDGNVRGDVRVTPF